MSRIVALFRKGITDVGAALGRDKISQSPSRRKAAPTAARRVLFFYATGLLLPSSAAVPNIVLIVADDLGYGDLGCYGQKHFQTPNIDALEELGMRFTQAYAGGPVCTSCLLYTSDAADE